MQALQWPAQKPSIKQKEIQQLQLQFIYAEIERTLHVLAKWDTDLYISALGL
jgi:hypothetical protein